MKGGRKYVAGLSQLNGGLLGATVTDETHAQNGNADLTTGNLCAGKTTPALATQGAWPLAAKYLKVPQTTMSCVPLGKLDFVDVNFSFDGLVIHAGDHTFTQADSAFSETLIIDPTLDQATNITDTVEKSNKTGVSLGMAEPGKLSFATLRLPDETRLMCLKK